MITKGKIKGSQIKENGAIYFDVDIYIFKSSGDKTATSSTIRAIACYNPTTDFSGYKDGDIVIVGFENNEFDRPIILGKLYNEKAFIDLSSIINESIDISKIDTFMKLQEDINNNKQNKLIAGENITIEDNVISAVASGESTKEIYNDTTHITNYTFEDNTEYTYQLAITSPYDDLTLIIPETIKQGFISVITLNDVVSSGLTINIQNNSNYTLRILDSYNRVVTSSSVHLTAGRKIIFCRCDGYYAEISIIEER